MKGFASRRCTILVLALCATSFFGASSEAVARQPRKTVAKPVVRAAKRAPTVEEVMAKAKVLRQSSQYSAAQKLLEARIKTMPSSAAKKSLQLALADVHFHWGKSFFASSHFENAIQHYQVALVIDRHPRPRNTAVDLNNIGLAYGKLSQYEKAREYYSSRIIMSYT